MGRHLKVAVALLALALLWVGGCSEPQMAALGSNSGIAIVAAPRCADEAAALKSLLEQEVLTVQYERAFEPTLIDPGRLGQERTLKNIVLLDYLEPPEEFTRTLLEVAGARRSGIVGGGLNYTLVEDRWAKGQAVMIIAARSRAELGELLSYRADEVFAFVEDCVQRRLNRALFYPGEDRALSDQLAEAYGWSFRLPLGYKADAKYASQEAVKLLKDEPARMITVCWQDAAQADTAFDCLEKKKWIAWEIWDEDEVVDDGLVMDRGTFLDWPCTVITGTWENRKYIIGGVFFTYCFKCEECGRSYLLDGAVFAPGFPKLPLVREVRAILTTFSCRHART